MGIELATTYILIVILSLFFILLLSASRRQQAAPPSDPHRQPSQVDKPVRGDELEVWPFMPRTLMTNAEVRFFIQLRQAVPEFLIFSQVGLSRLIECSDKEDEKFWFNRISRMSVDYVLVDQDGQRVLVAIELDDWSHDQPSRIKADSKKDKALNSAGIPMVRFQGGKYGSAAKIRQKLLQVLDQQ